MADVDEIVGRPEPVAPDDWRVGLAAEVVSADGSVLGKAVVLSPNIAVTTASVAGRAQTVVQTTSNANVSPGSIGLIFPQLTGPSSYPLTASIQGVDGELRFAAISLYAQPPVAVPSSLLGTGELPADGAECSVIYADDPLKGFFRILGQMENRTGGNSFVLYVDRLPSDSSQLMGTPVFFENRLLGIVTGGPSRSVAHTYILGVTSIRGMALSTATSAVRALLPWIPDESRVRGRESRVASAESASNSSGVSGSSPPTSPAFQQSAGSKAAGLESDPEVPGLANSARPGASPVHSVANATSETHAVVPEPSAQVEQPNATLGAETFARLSPSTRGALSRAEGMRIAMGLKEVHMEQLIVGLYEKYGGPTQRLLNDAKIDEPELRKIIHEVRDTEIPGSYSPFTVNAFPPFSEHASKAMQLAVRRSTELQTKLIRSRHLLYGVLSVEECGLVKALQDRGVRKENIAQVVPSNTSEKEVHAEANSDGREISHPPGDDVRYRDDAQGVIREGTELIQRHFYAITEIMKEMRVALDSASLGHFRRQILRLEFSDRSLKPMFLEEVLDAVEKFATEEGPRLLHDRGNASFTENLLAAAESLRKIIDQARHPANIEQLPEGFKADRVQKLIDDVHDQVMGVIDLTVGMEGAAATVRDGSASSASDTGAVQESASHPSRAMTTAGPTPKVDSDLWCEEDTLGYEAYARTIAALITHKETVPPLTIGIKAPWGAGKTSLMKRVQHLLDGRAELSEENRSGARQQGQAPRMTLRELLHELRQITKADKGTLKAGEVPKLPVPANKEGAERYGLPPRITVWFNAWKYQTSEQIWAGMAHCIISQVTARMTPLERELFWLRLHARRINTDEVRRKVHELLIRSLVPVTLVVVVACAIVIWVASLAPLLMPYQWSVRVVTALAGLIGLIWKARETLGEKAAGTMKELVREPDYEGKMGYLHLVESDIREVLRLVTEASPESRVASPESKSAPVAHGGDAGAKAPSQAETDDAALKRCSSTVVAGAVQGAGEFAGSHPTKPALCEAASVSTSKSTTPPSRINREKGGASASEPTETAGRTLRLRSGQAASAATQAPLVVFVDDLDRCAPNKVAEVVEAINLFLCGDYPNCIFVLGMEPGMVAAALEVANKAVIEKALEMGVADRTAPVGWRFMEKIVQLPIMIPPPTEDGRKAYVKSLVGSVEAVSPDRVEVAKEPPKEEEIQEFIRLMEGGTLAEVEKKSLEVVAQAPVEKHHAAAEAGKRVYARTFTERDPVISDFVKEVAELVDGNPRQIKRYVNVFRFYSTLRYGLQADGRATASELPSDKVLAKFVALTIQWPHAMDCLRAKNCLSAGKMVSRLEYLEAESAKITGDDLAGDESWKKILEGIGPGVGTWAQTRTFRNFLMRGEPLGRSAGHGLW